jgi:transcriptional regulator with XRE-family HTH domain
MGKPTKEVVRERERRAWALRQQGWTQERIAAELGVEQSTVSRILARLSDRYLRELSAAVGRMKAEQTAKLNELYFQVMQAWERSKGTRKAVRRQTTTGGDDDGAGSEHITQTAAECCGDVRYLIQARAILSDIRDLWGLNAPTRWELDANVEGPLPIREVQFMRPREVAADPVACDLLSELHERLAQGDAPAPQPPPPPPTNGHSS